VEANEMLYEIREQQEPNRHLAVTRFTASPDQIGARMSQAFGTVYEYVGRHGIHPIGPPVGCYEMGTRNTFEVLAGCVVDVPIEADGDIEPYVLQGGPALTTVHAGPYDELPKAYEALEAHAREFGQELDMTTMWEEYLTGPDVPADEMRTAIHWPLK
jgi:effector-binding domain-containing protein